MRPALVVILTLATLFPWKGTRLAFGEAATPPPSKLPRLELLASSRDFGRVQPRATLDHRVTFANTGGMVLRIGDFQRSCSCVQLPVSSLEVPPGTRATLELTLLASDLSGPFEETLSFTSNDPLHPTGSVTLRGLVFRRIEAVPDFAVLPVTPDSGTNEVVQVRILNHGDGPIEVREPHGSNPAFAARLIPRVPGREWTLELRTTRILPNASHYGPFTLQTSSPEVPELRVTAFVPGLPAVVATPREWVIDANAAAGSPTLECTILVRSTTDHSLEVSTPEIDVPGVETRLETREPGRLFAVRLRFPEDFRPAPGFKAVLDLRTNHPRFEHLRVPVRVRP